MAATPQPAPPPPSGLSLVPLADEARAAPARSSAPAVVAPAPRPEPRPVKKPLVLDLNDIDIPEELGSANEPGPGKTEVPRIRTVPELEQAIEDLNRKPMRRLGEALVETGRVTAEEVTRALELQKGTTRPLGEVLVAMGATTNEVIRTVIAEKLGIPTVDVRTFPASDEALLAIPNDVCVRHRMMPLHQKGGTLIVAMDNPMSSEALQAAGFASGHRVVPVLANGDDIREMLRSRGPGRAFWPTENPNAGFEAPKAQNSVPIFGGDSLEFDLSGVEELTLKLTQELHHDTEEKDEPALGEADSTLVKLVNKVILDAKSSNASDIHIEPLPGKRGTRIRMRRDGVLNDYAELPARFRSAIISRIKVMANLNIAERRKPQDGKIDFSKFGPAKLELRVATIPTNNGMENVILRLLAAAEPIPLERIGIEERILERLKALVERPHGLMLVCGPTGSGKTTTLHSLISHINTPERKIWTAEDPVEITQEGLAQVQVNPKIDWTFAAALRSFLRADPDVIMVGEMRDAETAAMGVEASLTGHLVLSTLHTNSAPETVTRLLDLGVDPFNFGDSLLGVLAQRLVRRVCPACGKPERVPDPQLETLAREYVSGTDLDAGQVLATWKARRNPPVFSQGAGCEACSGSGLKGRLGLYEFMEVTPDLRALIQARAPTDRIRERAIAQGMRTLKQDGIEKVLSGFTTLEQVRATGT